MAKRKRKARRKAGGSFTPKAWSVEDRRAFADGNFVRASSIAGSRFAGPTASEWR
jgi:hypothetical protein